MDVPKTSENIQIKVKIPNTSQEPPASSKASYQGLKDIDALCPFKIKIESKNLDHEYIKDKRPYPNQDQDAKPKSRTFSILKDVDLQNQDREPKIRT